MEYAGYLYPAALKSLPVATTIGNHDATNKSYSFHFNNPNSFTEETSPSVAGNGYYYTYGNALFVVLNTNNYNCADHEALLKKATEENPNTRWRIVMFHQDIYGSGLDHSESDGMVLRTQLTPILDKYDVDVVLQGHDHSYSRSYLLQGDGKTHPTYDAHKLADGSFDWDNVIDKSTKQVLPYYPDEKDAKAVAANALFLKGNEAYTITGDKSTKVVNPQGTLYMTANSATGSKFYELTHQQQNFIAYRNQNWQPSYSVLSLDDKTFSISTYSIAQDQVSQLDRQPGRGAKAFRPLCPVSVHEGNPRENRGNKYAEEYGRKIFCGSKSERAQSRYRCAGRGVCTLSVPAQSGAKARACHNRGAYL